VSFWSALQEGGLSDGQGTLFSSSRYFGRCYTSSRDGLVLSRAHTFLGSTGGDRVASKPFAERGRRCRLRPVLSYVRDAPQRRVDETDTLPRTRDDLFLKKALRTPELGCERPIEVMSRVGEASSFSPPRGLG